MPESTAYCFVVYHIATDRNIAWCPTRNCARQLTVKLNGNDLDAHAYYPVFYDQPSDWRYN